jgi:hypothetical protein
MEIANQMEIGITYKDIPEWEGYKAGEDGSIWSCHIGRKRRGLGTTWKKLKPRTREKTRHQFVSLFTLEGKRRLMSVHRLVLITFSGMPAAGMECCHNNGNGSDNRLINLRWDTRKGNMADQLLHGTRNHGERNGSAKLTIEGVREIRRRIAAGESQKSIAASMGVCQPQICHINTGKTWAHAS